MFTLALSPIKTITVCVCVCVSVFVYKREREREAEEREGTHSNCAGTSPVVIFFSSSVNEYYWARVAQGEDSRLPCRGFRVPFHLVPNPQVRLHEEVHPE